MRATRAISVCAVLLTLASSYLALAESPRPRYTTLILEYVGETDRYAPPVVISTSQEEGKWYKQHLFPEPGHFLVHVQVVPQAVLNEITELPLLKRALESAKPVDDESKTPQNVSFTAGVGHDYAQIILDKQPSAKILKGIDKIVAKYPSLKGELQEIDDHVRP
jgi:hypothetical protein